MKNPVATLNEFCQKSKLSYNFEKFKENGQSNSKNFTVRLTVSKLGSTDFIEYFGDGKSLKDAKIDASNKALKTNILEEIRKNSSSSINSNYSYITDREASLNDNENFLNSCSKESMKELATEIAEMNFDDKNLNLLYQIWINSKKLNIPISIDLVNIQKEISNIKISVELNLGPKSYAGHGKTDLEAILNAANKVSLQELYCLKIDQEISFEEDTSHHVVALHELHQKIEKDLEFIDLAGFGPAQNPFYLNKCRFGDLITYGLGSKKKSAKNASAAKMLEKLDENVTIENFDIKIKNKDKLDDKTRESVNKILKSEQNAISILDQLDRKRSERTLKFIESSQMIGIQTYYTAECRLLYMPDLNIQNEDTEECYIKKNDLTFLKTTAKSTKKKLAKTEAAEMMVNLLRGLGPFTNNHAKTVKEFKEFKDISFKSEVNKNDDINQITNDQFLILHRLVDKTSKFLKDKPNYDKSYDFLAELQDLEVEYRDFLKLNVRLSDVETTNNFFHFDIEKIDTLKTVVISLECGIIFCDKVECDDENEAKNQAAYGILKKLSNYKRSCF